MNKTQELENIQQIVEDLENVEHFVHDPQILQKIESEIKSLKSWYSEEIEAMGEVDEMRETEELGVLPKWPFINLNVSGLYQYVTKRFNLKESGRIVMRPDGMIEGNLPDIPFPPKGIAINKLYYLEDLRLDVDGRYPQMAASGTIKSIFANVHWIAKLNKKGRNNWEGDIWYKRGNVSFFRYNKVSIMATRSIFTSAKSVKVVFSGTGVRNRVINLPFASVYSREVEFEFDYEAGINPITAVDPVDHPNHPATLTSEILTIDKVFRRAGFNVRHTHEDGSIPPSLKGINGTWSNSEMHDAMQTYWSKFTNAPQWSLWTLFAKQHDYGHGLGGIMFDSIGPNHRQGTALFYDSFIADAPAGDADQTAWVKRMKFWTAIHEMGHAFNLAHSWQKEYGNPWIPTLTNEPEARSFMNYPYGVDYGQSAFFADFEYRFSNQELLFMRHAPAEFVQMGNADWFDNHGFEWANVSPDSGLKLDARVNRESLEFEFMEPVNVELKLKNIARYPETISANILKNTHDMTIVIKRNDDPAKLYRGYSTACFDDRRVVLNTEEALYESLFLSSGKDGWLISEPGYYTIQVCITGEREDLLSNPLTIRVNPPRSYDESYLAQDYFTDEVGRILAFKGTRAEVFKKGVQTLEEVAARLKDTRAGKYADVALATPLTRSYKMLRFETERDDHLSSVSQLNDQVQMLKPDYKAANKRLDNAIGQKAKDDKQRIALVDQAVETLGHIESKPLIDTYTDSLVQEDNKPQAVKLQESLLKVYETRNIIKHIRDEVKSKIKDLRGN